jgi:hypothetical protein
MAIPSVRHRGAQIAHHPPAKNRVVGAIAAKVYLADGKVNLAQL